MIDIDDDRLAEVLASVGNLLQTAAPAAAATEARPPRSRRGLWQPRAVRWAFVVVVVLAVVAVTVAPVRRTVADWLGIGSTQIDIGPASSVAPLPSIATGIPPLDEAAAAAKVDVDLAGLGASALGAPSAFADMPEGGVLVIWRDGTSLWIHRPLGPEPSDWLHKMVAEGEDVQEVTGLGEDALVVSGTHMLETPHRTVAATTVVLWLSGDLELRLESDRDPSALIELARQLDAAL
jgi:hypothetical protein